jgi:hypothetical protein
VPRVVRRSENQRLFREVNERIAELSARLDAPDGAQSFFCECARVGCREMLEAPLAVYAIVRDDADLYVVIPGHEDPAREQTVADHGAFLIVRTLSGEADIAAPAALQPTART